MSVKTRLSPREKLRIFLEGLKDNVKVAEVSSLRWRDGVHPRTRALAAQKVRKIENRRRKINPSINEEMTSVKNRNKKILV